MTVDDHVLDGLLDGYDFLTVGTGFRVVVSSSQPSSARRSPDPARRR